MGLVGVGGGVVGWFHAGVRPWGLSALLLAVGFPCPLGLVGLRPLLCVWGWVVIPWRWVSGCWWVVVGCWWWFSSGSGPSGFACLVGGLLVGCLLGVVAGCSLLATVWWGVSPVVCGGGCRSGCVKARRCATQGAACWVPYPGWLLCACAFLLWPVRWCMSWFAGCPSVGLLSGFVVDSGGHQDRGWVAILWRVW